MPTRKAFWKEGSRMAIWIKVLALYGNVMCVFSVLQGPNARNYPDSGVEFPDSDLLIGPPSLWNNGNQWDRNSADYYITLMVQEGRVVLSQSGYLIGFQWYSSLFHEDDRIKVQIYRRNKSGKETNPDLPETLEGLFTLVYQTPFIPCQEGLNVFYLPQSMAVDTTGGEVELIMAFMIPPRITTPVLHDYCTGGTQVALKSTVPDLNLKVGDKLKFTLEESFEQCISYSIQGIFVPTTAASSEYKGEQPCTMCIAELGGPDCVIKSPDSYPSIVNMCWIVRSGRYYEGLKVTANHLEMSRGTSDYCSQYVNVVFKSSISDSDPGRTDKQIITCHDTDFDSERSTVYSYAVITFSTGTEGSHTRFQFTVQSEEIGSVWLGIFLVIILPLASILIIIICIIFCCCKGWCSCCCCAPKQKGTVHERDQENTTELLAQPSANTAPQATQYTAPPASQAYPQPPYQPQPPPPQMYPPMGSQTQPYVYPPPGQQQPPPPGSSYPASAPTTTQPPIAYPAYGAVYPQGGSGGETMGEKPPMTPPPAYSAVIPEKH